MNNILSVHYLIDFYECDTNYLISVYKIKKLMIKAGEIGNFNVVKGCFHQFKPYGVSGVLVLKESHFTIHTWPENQYAAVDIFLCDTSLNIDKVVKYLCKIFSTNNYKIRKINRGLFSNNIKVNDFSL